MPLVIFTGFPCSGKTTHAKRLVEQLETKIQEAKPINGPGHNYSVVYHSDETLGIDHKTYYDLTLEKHARGTQMLAVKRDIGRGRIVVLDSLAYIKGFRYQLYCEAKGVGTPHCVVQVMSLEQKCIERNNNNNGSNTKWDPELISQLVMRYEEPNNSTRWDSPLFSVMTDEGDDELNIDDIWEALVLKRAPPPNAATVVKPTSGNNFLQELDSQTSAVVSKICQHQQLFSIGGDVLIDKENNLYVEMPSTAVSLAQLQRLRRTYITLNRMRTIDVDRITPMFVEYVNTSLSKDH
ncbi:uncharacterized protein KQ657_003508 [Scheffersomyces spartinae]|uniref:Protein KTI12 n=1 Tax=Scheffersomyces spartinae TaxID=45513 RepID=A0A9P7V521_9ASCO|nr:uncharacterized protein KQ657_003508 [Scheffersomyces spartinae]KAG7191387.1 hypothetical protein KQ657_003508 [Scheffersomyces spartinae]